MIVEQIFVCVEGLNFAILYHTHPTRGGEIYGEFIELSV